MAFTTIIDWLGWLAMVIFLLWVLWGEQQTLRHQLREEVIAGRLSAAQYRTATSAWAQSFARLGALFSGRYLATARFYQVCGELAHKKEQLARVGDEGGNMIIIENLRRELAQLSSIAQT